MVTKAHFGERGSSKGWSGPKESKKTSLEQQECIRRESEECCWRFRPQKRALDPVFEDEALLFLVIVINVISKWLSIR